MLALLAVIPVSAVAAIAWLARSLDRDRARCGLPVSRMRADDRAEREAADVSEHNDT
jgi:hypothetical protein